MTTRWADHLTGHLLPWWSARAVDDERGGVRTGFANDGTLRTADRFTWSQGRWAWLAGELADDGTAGVLDVDAALWRERCLATCERLVADAVRPDLRCHFRVTEDGDPVPGAGGETATSVFADLFCVLGLSGGLRQVDGDDPRAGAWAGVAAGVLSAARDAIAAGTALTEPYPVPDGYVDLAGPMTLLHTAAELLRTPAGATGAAHGGAPGGDGGRAGNGGGRAGGTARAAGSDAAGAAGRVTGADAAGDAHVVAREVRDWAVTRLRDRHVGPGLWAEFALTEPGLDDTLLARHRTPGHLLELLWMIDHAQRDAGEPAGAGIPSAPVAWTRDELAALAHAALAIGWDDEHGGLLRYADSGGGVPRGRPTPGSPYEDLVRATWGTKLWWVHAEAVYSLHLLARHDPTLARWADRVTDWTMRTFPDPENGEWLQIRDRSGAPLDEVVALPVKDPFHAIRAMILLNRLDAGAAAPEEA